MVRTVRRRLTSERRWSAGTTGAEESYFIPTLPVYRVVADNSLPWQAWRRVEIKLHPPAVAGFLRDGYGRNRRQGGIRSLIIRIE
jgi:hypothetical protein